MKLEELGSLVSGMNLRNVLIKPEDVTFNIGDNRRNQLRDFGFGKYMEDEWILPAYYYREYRDMQKQVEELQQ